jgi:hypothetical protein
MLFQKAAGINVIIIAREGLWGRLIPLRCLDCGHCLRRPPGLYSDRTFQVANLKCFLRLLLVFIVLICPIFGYFSFVICVFSVDGELAYHTTP